MAIYLLADDLTGNVTTKNFNNAIEIHEVNLETSRPVSQKIGSSENRIAGHFQIGQVRITKALDNASNTLLRYYFDAKVIPELHIKHVSAGNNPVEYASETYYNALITNHKRTSNADGVMEVLELSFTKYDVGYTKRNADGTMQSPSYTGYNLETASRL